jgi:hypothetical protein
VTAAVRANETQRLGERGARAVGSVVADNQRVRHQSLVLCGPINEGSATSRRRLKNC